jgi:hypothetical protein
MKSAHDSVREKVSAIFTELAGSRARQLDGFTDSESVRSVIVGALRGHYPEAAASEIAFHLNDWNYDAAFLVALHLFPERFTPEEIRAAIGPLLAHVPDHVAMAAKLAGYKDAE